MLWLTGVAVTWILVTALTLPVLGRWLGAADRHRAAARDVVRIDGCRAAAPPLRVVADQPGDRPAPDTPRRYLRPD